MPEQDRPECRDEKDSDVYPQANIIRRERRRARPNTKIPANYLSLIREAMSLPYSIADLPAILGISENNFATKRKEDGGKINHAIQVGRAKLKENLVGPLYKQAMAGDTDMAKWLLTRIFPGDFNPNTKKHIEAAVQDNRVVQIVQMPSALTPDQYAELIKGLAPPQVIEHVPE